jgi:hypothetical protein
VANGPKITEITPGGSGVFEEAGSPTHEPVSTEPSRFFEDVSRHVEHHLGPVAFVIHETVSETVHMDVLVVAPSASRDFWTFVTAGMSHLPMTLDEGSPSELAYAELVIALPSDRFARQKSQVTASRPEDYPINWLKWLALFPHQNQTWLGHGHTLPITRPIGPDTQMSGFLLAHTDMGKSGFEELKLANGTVIYFYAVFPIHDDEMTFKLEHGTQPLLERMHDAGVTEIFENTRPSVLDGK